VWAAVTSAGQCERVARAYAAMTSAAAFGMVRDCTRADCATGWAKDQLPSAVKVAKWAGWEGASGSHVGGRTSARSTTWFAWMARETRVAAASVLPVRAWIVRTNADMDGSGCSNGVANGQPAIMGACLPVQVALQELLYWNMGCGRSTFDLLLI